MASSNTTMTALRSVMKMKPSSKVVDPRRGFQPAVYGGQHTVTVMPGDGANKEMTAHAINVLKATKAPMNFDYVKFDKDNNTEDDYTNALLSFKRNRVGLKGALELDFRAEDFQSLNAVMRRDLELFANVVAVQHPGDATAEPFDIVICRQNTGGEYSLKEHMPREGVAEYLKVMTRAETQRLARFAFAYALRTGRRRVTCVHKANIQKLSDGLFLETCRDVAKEFPEIEFADMIVDNCAMQLASRPSQFDVLLTTNLYGSVCSNLVCGLAGGAGRWSGCNVGEQMAVFEPATRNPGTCLPPDTANPVAMVSAAIDLLRHIGHAEAADRVTAAVRSTLWDDRLCTQDMGGDATSTQVVDSIIEKIKAQ